MHVVGCIFQIHVRWLLLAAVESLALFQTLSHVDCCNKNNSSTTKLTMYHVHKCTCHWKFLQKTNKCVKEFLCGEKRELRVWGLGYLGTFQNIGAGDASMCTLGPSRFQKKYCYVLTFYRCKSFTISLSNQMLDSTIERG